MTKKLDDGRTALHVACESYHPRKEQIVARLLCAGASTEDHYCCAISGARRSPLGIACIGDDPATARLLVSARARLYFPLRELSVVHEAPLAIACQNHSANVLQVLLEESATSIHNELDSTYLAYPLLCACAWGAAACVRLLIDARASPNLTSLSSADRALMQRLANSEATPLTSFCASHGALLPPRLVARGYDARHVEIAELLLEAGAAVDAPSGMSTPLGFACLHGHMRLAQMLSSYGARRARVFDSGSALEHLFGMGGDTHWGIQTDAALALSAEEVAMREGHEQLAAWLRQSADWTSPLHHIMGLSVGRTRALLRAGAHTRVHMHIGTCAWHTRRGGRTPQASPTPHAHSYQVQT